MKNILLLFIFSYSICNAQNFINPSLETWGIIDSCDINIAPDNWMNYTNGNGIGMDEVNFSSCPTTIPPFAANGNVCGRASARTDTTGEGMFQIISGFIIGNVYQITFDYAGSNLYTGTSDIQWHVFIDNVDINQTIVFSSTDSIWTTHSFNFTATATNHIIGFRAYTISPTEHGSAAIDNLSIKNTEGIDNTISDNNVLLFPNPFSLQTTLHTDKIIKEATLTVYNSYGRQVKELKYISGHTIILHRDNLPCGLYFISITQDNKTFFTDKIVITDN